MQLAEIFFKKKLIFLFIGTILVATGILYVGLPASPDQLELDYLAGLVLDGGTPYVDFVDNNWPGGYWLHMISTAFFGHTLHSWRVFDYLIMLAGLYFLCDLLRHTSGPQSALWAAVLYPGLYTTAVSFWFPGQRDAVIANFFWIILWLHWRAWKTGRPRWQLLTGFLLALATLVKPTAILIGPLLVLHGLWLSIRNNRSFLSEFPAQEVTVTAAGAGTLIIAFAGIIFSGTSVDLLLDSVWYFNAYPQAVGRIATRALMQKALSIHMISWHWITIVSCIAAGWLFFIDQHLDAGIKILFVVVWIAGWGSYLLQGRGYPYHLAIVYLAMLPFLFIGLGRLSQTLPTISSLPCRFFAVLVIGVVLAGTAKKYTSQYRNTFCWLTGQINTVSYYDKFSAGDGMTLAGVDALLPKLEKAVAPGETLLVIGTQSALNYLLQRRQPTRFYYFPIFLEARVPSAMVTRWNIAFRKEIKVNHSPMALINRTVFEKPPYSQNKMTLKSLRLLQTELAINYTKLYTIGKTDLYRRNSLILMN